MQIFNISSIVLRYRQWRRQGRAKGGGGGCPPKVEKDGPRNSSKFDEKIEGGGGYPSQM